MKTLKKDLFNPYFSHIYIEKEAFKYATTNKILDKFKNSKVIEINHYKDIFSRTHQNFYLQKQSPSLILAVKKDNLIYKGAKFCDSFGNKYFYYTSSMMNCIYNCEYCYLQGMYSSANIVIFVNIDDIFTEVKNLLLKHEVYLCISYDTDILAFENTLGYGRRWLEFASKHENLQIELRTKSANFKSLINIPVCKNVIFAWTLSPEEIINNYEDKTPRLEYRLQSAKEAIIKGYKVRLCFDPILYLENYEENYKNLIDKTFSILPKDKIFDISLGVFRVSKDYLKIMRRQRFCSPILNYPFKTIDKVCSYDKTLSHKLIKTVYTLINKYIPKEKIYIGRDD